MSNQAPFRTGDIVHHRPTDEKWTVAAVWPAIGDLAWVGWPDGHARISDCDLIKQATDKEHWTLVEKIAKSNSGSRTAYCQRLLAERDSVRNEEMNGATLLRSMHILAQKLRDDSEGRPDEPTFMSLDWLPNQQEFHAQVIWDHHDGFITEQQASEPNMIAVFQSLAGQVSARGSIPERTPEHPAAFLTWLKTAVGTEEFQEGTQSEYAYDFYTAWRAGLLPAEALKQAQAQARESF